MSRRRARHVRRLTTCIVRRTSLHKQLLLHEMQVQILDDDLFRSSDFMRLGRATSFPLFLPPLNRFGVNHPLKLPSTYVFFKSYTYNVKVE